MTSCIFRILLACPPCEVGHGRVAEVEDFGMALALGTAADMQVAYPPPIPEDLAPDEEGRNEGTVLPSIKALIWASYQKVVDVSVSRRAPTET